MMMMIIKYTRDRIKLKSQDIVKMAINIICICQKQLEFHTTRRLGVISIHFLIQSFSCWVVESLWNAFVVGLFIIICFSEADSTRWAQFGPRLWWFLQSATVVVGIQTRYNSRCLQFHHRKAQFNGKEVNEMSDKFLKNWWAFSILVPVLAR